MVTKFMFSFLNVGTELGFGLFFGYLLQVVSCNMVDFIEIPLSFNKSLLIAYFIL